MIQYLKQKLSPNHPLRLFYHQLVAVTAAVYYRFPARFLNVIAVTGTKGKTTTTNLITAILTEAGYKVGMTSTVNFQVGTLRWSNLSKITTLGPFFLQKLLRRMVDEGCTHAVLEVSSHAIIQNRVWGINVDTAVFTNISEEHLDYHGGFQSYLRAKGLLFDRLNRSARKPRIPKNSILNQDDPNFVYFDQFLVDRKYTYGMSRSTCYATNLKLNPAGSTFTLHVPNYEIEVQFKLPGQFNVYNALAASTVALAYNINLNVVKTSLEKATPIPGRFETIDCGQPFTVVVDYAHTADSLEKLLSLYRDLTDAQAAPVAGAGTARSSGKLWVVFGATGGGRDKGKRPKMGAVAHQYADYVILTDDDPYEDDEWQIVEDIAAGVERTEGERFWKIPSRREAIRLALQLAQAGDTVILAGKGAEEIQMIGGGKIAWDDRACAREILSQTIQVDL